VGWSIGTHECDHNTESLIGPVGDPLGFRVVATFNPDTFDFRGHTWLCQIRLSAPGAVVATLTLIGDDTTETEIDLLFALADTTVLTDGVCYVIGVSAVDGDYAPWTMIESMPVHPTLPVARPVP